MIKSLSVDIKGNQIVIEDNVIVVYSSVANKMEFNIIELSNIGSINSSLGCYKHNLGKPPV